MKEIKALSHPNWTTANAWATSTPEQIRIDIEAALAMLSRPGGVFPSLETARGVPPATPLRDRLKKYADLTYLSYSINPDGTVTLEKN